jgi:hypothetical protein
MRIQSKALLAALLLAGASAGVAAAETTYSGTGNAVTSYTLLPLANGGAAVQMTNSNVATIAPSDPGFIYGDCAGLGYMPPEKETMTGTFYCTFRESAADSFDIKGTTEQVGQGTVEIIGGSGKWKDASGSGSFKRKFADGNRTTYDYEFRITTP